MSKVFKDALEGWFTTLIGMVIMGLSIYYWSQDELTELKALGGLIVGFIFIRMKDAISVWLERLFTVALDGFKLWTKQFNKNDYGKEKEDSQKSDPS